MRQNLSLTGRILELPQDANILSTTDTQSCITYVNSAASIHEVASNAQNAANAAEKADHETRAGHQLVAYTSESIIELENDVKSSLATSRTESCGGI
jgi:methyl-accepting chemotaxis protein